MPFPRIKDLPEAERQPFVDWLQGQTRPIDESLPPTEEQDCYYQYDYLRWKEKLRSGWEMFD